MGYRKKRTVYVRQREPLPMKSKYGAPRSATPVDMLDTLYSGAGSHRGDTPRGAITNPAASIHNEYIDVASNKSVVSFHCFFISSCMITVFDNIMSVFSVQTYKIP